MNRRQFLKLGVPVGALALGGRYALMPPRRSAELAPVSELTARLIDGLEPGQREQLCLPFDSPWRQYHNRGLWGGGLRVFGTGLSRANRGLITDLFHAGLSAVGRAIIPNQFFLNWPGVHSCTALVCGDPREGPYQVILTGPHLNLRLGGASPEGAAFGGPQVWGEQRGNEVPGMPGNLHRPQFAAGQAVAAALPKTLLDEAQAGAPPIQTDIEPRGPGGPFPGACVGDFPAPAVEAVRALIDSVFRLWPDEDAAYAWRCLEANGGLAALHFAVFDEGRLGGFYPVFRLEGPGAVIHYRGWPHLHAFCHVTLDGANPMRVGEVLCESPRVLEGRAAAELFERALVSQTGADLGYYPTDSVAARLPAGPVRTGDVYTLESWFNSVALLEVSPDKLAAELAGRLTPEQRARPRVAVATTDYVAGYLASERIGPHRAGPDPDLSMRDALLAHLRAHGCAG